MVRRYIMKNILLGLFVLSTSAFAGVNGSIGYSSDYMWRGVSQSAGASSFNAGIELDSNGFFVGAWIGEVDFGDEATQEQDLYLGYNLDVMDNLDVQLGLIQYRYDKGDYDTVEEGFVKVGYNNLTVSYFLDTDTEDDYAHVSYDLWFVNGVDATIGYGYHDRNDDFSTLSLSKDFNNFTLSALIMLDEAFENQTSDSVSFGLSYNF
jgi:uncharacterized protein (TIGR02001 family)